MNSFGETICYLAFKDSQVNLFLCKAEDVAVWNRMGENNQLCLFGALSDSITIIAKNHRMKVK